MSDHTPARFSDEQASAILARAIEIDARAPLTTTEDLRVIAAELGVSAAALEAALHEQTTSVKARRAASLQRTATRIANLGMPLGVLAGWLFSSGAALPTLGLTAVGLVVSGLAVYQSVSGSLRAFHIKNLVLWGGACAGSLVSLAVMGSGRMPLMIMVGWCLRGWIASSILGSAAVIAVQRARQSDHGDPAAGAPDAAGSPGDSRWTRLLKRVLGAIMGPLRHGATHWRLAGR